MKKRLLSISLVLVSVLTALMPTAVLAAKPVEFKATGNIAYITEGDVLPAGNSGQWRVIERELGGTLSGDINGAFTLNYKANVELATQAGNLHGTLQAGSQVLEVNGKIEPLKPYHGNAFYFVMEYVDPVFGLVRIYYVPGVGYVPLFDLEINGHWTSVSGANGNGDFTASVIFIPTPEGHVAYVLPVSQVNLTGK